MGFRIVPTTGPVTVAGGTIDTVNNPVTASSVTNPVSTNPASTISTVSTSVPFPFRDGAFWPCVSGEQLPPAFGTGGSYRSGGNTGLPCVQLASSAAATEATWPQLPRVSFAGKQALTVSGKIALTGTGAGARTFFGLNSSSAPTGRCAFFSLVGSGANVEVDFTYWKAGAAVTVPNVVAAFAPGALGTAAWHTWSIAVDSAGALTVTWDGAVVLTDNTAIWAPSAAEVPQLVGAANGSGPSAQVAALQAAWS